MDEKIKISRKKHLKGDDGHKTFSIRVREDIATELDNISAQTNRSRNELINMFLEYGVTNWELSNSKASNPHKKPLILSYSIVSAVFYCC